MTIYLIHMDRPVAEGRPAQHYIGFVEEDPLFLDGVMAAEKRLDLHRKGRGAKILKAAALRGIPFRIARLWEGDRHSERRLKNRKEAPALCPLCSAARDSSPKPVSYLKEIEIDAC